MTELSTVQRWCVAAARAAADKKGQSTVILAMEGIVGIVDAMVITSCDNVRQVRTVVEEVEERVKLIGGPPPRRIEGLGDAGWVLMDYGDFLVHVFLDELRRFYDLERLWADAPRWDWDGGVGVGVAVAELSSADAGTG